MRAYGLDLPEYPWETLIPYRKLAAEHPGGTIDLSIGTPVDDTPAADSGCACRSIRRPRIPDHARNC